MDKTYWLHREVDEEDAGCVGFVINPDTLFLLTSGRGFIAEKYELNETGKYTLESKLVIVGPRPRWSAFRTQELGVSVKRIAEIGVQYGYNAWIMHRFFNPEELCLIDPYTEQPDGMNGLKTSESSMIKAHTLLEELSNLAGLRWFKERSQTAYKHFPDEYFDFVYVDGDYSYENVKEDILSWYPKLRKGGVMAGQDYLPRFPGMVKAVDELCPGREQQGREWLVVKNGPLRS